MPKEARETREKSERQVFDTSVDDFSERAAETVTTAKEMRWPRNWQPGGGICVSK